MLFDDVAVVDVIGVVLVVGVVVVGVVVVGVVVVVEVVVVVLVGCETAERPPSSRNTYTSENVQIERDTEVLSLNVIYIYNIFFCRNRNTRHRRLSYDRGDAHGSLLI